jgi:hypothetical protein
MAEVVTIEDAARLYRKVEARLTTKKEAYEKACAKDKHALEQLELIMLQLLKAAGTDKMNVPEIAEVVIAKKRTFGCSDWDTFWTWLQVHNRLELLQKRIHEGNMQAFIDDKQYGGFIPPTVNVFTEAFVKVLKPK